MSEQSFMLLTFEGGDEWKAEELSAFLANIYILYNRIIVLHTASPSTAASLERMLSSSKSKVDASDKLRIDLLEIRSPIKLSLKGLGEPIKEIRGLLRDLWGGNRLAVSRMREFARHEYEMNVIEEQRGRISLLSAALNEADRLGASDEERKQIVTAILHPAGELSAIAAEKKLAMISQQEENR